MGKYSFNQIKLTKVALLSSALVASCASHASDPTKLSEAKKQLQAGGSFQMLDGSEGNGIKFLDDKTAVILGGPWQKKIQYTVVPVEPSFGNRKGICVYSLSRGQLTWLENKMVLYPDKSSEAFVARKMRALKKFAQQYYQKTGCYPNDARKWQGDAELTYNNPCTGAMDSPNAKLLNGTLDKDYLFPNIGTKEAFEFLQSGGSWRDQVASPCAIRALSLFVAKRCSDGFKITEFYGIGFDRNSKPLRLGPDSNLLVIGLKDGKDLSEDVRSKQQKSFEPHEPLSVVVSD